jgi:hypothetical protein
LPGFRVTTHPGVFTAPAPRGGRVLQSMLGTGGLMRPGSMEEGCVSVSGLDEDPLQRRFVKRPRVGGHICRGETCLARCHGVVDADC